MKKKIIETTTNTKPTLILTTHMPKKEWYAEAIWNKKKNSISIINDEKIEKDRNIFMKLLVQVRPDFEIINVLITRI